MIQADARPMALCGQPHPDGETCAWCERSPAEQRFAELVHGLEELLDATEAAAARCKAEPLLHTDAGQLERTAKVLETAFLEIDISVDCIAYFLIANELPIAQEAPHE